MIDINYRPSTYFRPQKLEEYLLSKVKGAVLKRKLKALFSEGRHKDAADLIGEANQAGKALESIHPMFMGGNYLPDNEEGEIEIARIGLASTTYDVTSVYARAEDGVIHYRVVDEYGGDTIEGKSETRSLLPLTLGELTDFFLSAWSLADVVACNFEDDLDSGLDFFEADSEFYPDFDALCRERVTERYEE